MHKPLFDLLRRQSTFYLLNEGEERFPVILPFLLKLGRHWVLAAGQLQSDLKAVSPNIVVILHPPWGRRGDWSQRRMLVKCQTQEVPPTLKPSCKPIASHGAMKYLRRRLAGLNAGLPCSLFLYQVRRTAFKMVLGITTNADAAFRTATPTMFCCWVQNHPPALPKPGAARSAMWFSPVPLI